MRNVLKDIAKQWFLIYDHFWLFVSPKKKKISCFIIKKKNLSGTTHTWFDVWGFEFEGLSNLKGVSPKARVLFLKD